MYFVIFFTYVSLFISMVSLLIPFPFPSHGSLFDAIVPHLFIIFCSKGNDLSRILRWGGGYTGSEDTSSLLLSIDQANVTALDR